MIQGLYSRVRFIRRALASAVEIPNRTMKFEELIMRDIKKYYDEVDSHELNNTCFVIKRKSLSSSKERITA